MASWTPGMSSPSRPNIVFIVADDLGYADLGCYGGRVPDVSQHLDTLAADGILFTEGYSNSPVCSPTRFALMTARYQYRLRGAAEEPINSNSRGSTTLGLPPSHPTLPSLLRDAGYCTALVGKWHLGYPPAFGPLRSGYDTFWGPMAGGVDYFRHVDFTGRHDLMDGEEDAPQEGYLTDLISQRAVHFVERMGAESQAAPAATSASDPRERPAVPSNKPPFFLSVHYTAPHWPWEAREDRAVADNLGGSLLHHSGGSIHTYRSMITQMDEGIGALLDALERTGAAHNTLVVFTSDNGGERFSDNWPLVGGKMDLTEGGIRVPWLARWPALIPAGTVSRQHCLTMDWSATMLDAAGVSAHPDYPLDGVSLMPVLRDVRAEFARTMAWRMNHRGQRALRRGNWKYLMVDGIEYLFDLTADERERANRAPLEAERLREMRLEWEAWDASMPGIPADATIGLGYSVANMPQR